jgi:hypothetical protein
MPGRLLLWPGPDVLVVDEAHALKKETNVLSRVLAHVDSQHSCTYLPLTQPTNTLVPPKHPFCFLCDCLLLNDYTDNPPFTLTPDPPPPPHTAPPV